jgi:hypothetical protein
MIKLFSEKFIIKLDIVALDDDPREKLNEQCTWHFNVHDVYIKSDLLITDSTLFTYFRKTFSLLSSS